MQHVIILAPPLTLSRDEIDPLVGVVRESIEAAVIDVAAEGRL